MFSDLPQSVCDVVVHQLMLMHEQNVQLCTMKERFACLEDSLAKTALAPSGGPVSIQTPIPDLFLPRSCDDGVDLDCVSDHDTSDGSSCATFFGDDLTALEPDRLRDCLYDIIRYDRCWGRLWKVFCDCLNLRQWEDVNPMDIAHFLPAARGVISLAHPDANVNVSNYTPWMCRLTGGLELVLVDTLHVQYNVFASPWNAVSPAMLPPIDACQELGALPLPLLQDAVAHSRAVCCVRSDTHINATDAELSTLDSLLSGPHTFRLVVMLNRALSATWNMWVANWEPKGRAALIWGCDVLRLRTYEIQGGTEAWSDVPGPWESYVIESGLQPVGVDICGATCNNALRNFCRRKAQKSFYHPTPAYSKLQASDNSDCDGVPAGYDPTSLDAFWDNGMRLHCAENAS